MIYTFFIDLDDFFEYYELMSYFCNIEPRYSSSLNNDSKKYFLLGMV
jgi:hypothetical protein